MSTSKSKLVELASARKPAVVAGRKESVVVSGKESVETPKDSKWITAGRNLLVRRIGRELTIRIPDITDVNPELSSTGKSFSIAQSAGWTALQELELPGLFLTLTLGVRAKEVAEYADALNIT